jgi:hypothetical protein
MLADVEEVEVVVAHSERAWWSLRCLSNVRWLAEHGFGPPEERPEVAVLDPIREPCGGRAARCRIDVRNDGFM